MKRKNARGIRYHAVLLARSCNNRQAIITIISAERRALPDIGLPQGSPQQPDLCCCCPHPRTGRRSMGYKVFRRPGESRRKLLDVGN
ncbi:unnamed protein product [Arctia plantaginis]|uniref:Uncharacterized protein n=1 Tax=Arctia plantaginis TaxID=874455 RepID=A0A8S0ZCZ0_ARCPL|nr:unnamed protein product [Arctia plantaginis]